MPKLNWRQASLFVAERIISVVVVALATRAVFVTHSGLGTLSLVALGVICVFAFVGRMSWRESLLALASWALLKIYRDAFPSVFIFDLLANPLSAVLLAAAVAPSVIRLGQLLARVKVIQWLHATHKRRLAVYGGFSLVLSAYTFALLQFRHGALVSHVYDFGIFDQALYMLGFHGWPASTTRQMISLFYDHQHFALYALAPLYWIGRGFHGVTMNIITVALLIPAPAYVLYRTLRTIAVRVANLVEPKLEYVIAVASLVLAVHPFTQSALHFFFHELYLVPVAFTLLLWVLVAWVLDAKKRGLKLVGIVAATLFWLAVKEDQYIFVAVFWLQAGVLIWLSKRRVPSITLPKFWVAIPVTMLLLAAIYGQAFLPAFRGGHSNTNYLSEYNLAKESLSSLAQGKASWQQTVEAMQWNSQASMLLYQHWFVFDGWSVFAFPGNVLGNYAERLFATTQPLRDPYYHHGSPVPIFAVVGAAALAMLWTKKRRLVIAVFTLSTIFGFFMVLGWREFRYFYPDTAAFYREYVNDIPERTALYEIMKNVSPDASLITSSHYAAQFSARAQIKHWPESAILSPDTPGVKLNDESTFEYWLIPKQSEDKHEPIESYRAITKDLLEMNYKLVGETPYQLLLQKP